MAKVLVLLAHGFEEIEAIVPADILRRAGFKVTLASVAGELSVSGGHQITIQADSLIVECRPEQFDVLVIPGGNPGVPNLLKSPHIPPIIQHFYSSGKLIAAICAAPLVLQKAGILKKHRVTSYPGVKSDLTDIKDYSEERVVSDGNLITSRGAGTAELFAFSIVERLLGPETAKKVAQSMVCDIF